VSGVSFCASRRACGSASPAIAPRVYYLDMLRTRATARAAADAVHAGRVAFFRARDGAGRASPSRAGGAGAPRPVPQAQPAHPPRLSPTWASIVHEHGRESHPISTFRLPDGLTVEGMYEGLKQRGFSVYRAKGDLPSATSKSPTWASLSDATIGRVPRAVTEVAGAARARGPRAARP